MQFCEGLVDPVDGTVDVPSTLEDSVATYNCDVGHNLVGGDMTRACERNANTIPGDWSGTAPECISMFCCIYECVGCIKYKLSCPDIYR